MNKQQKINAYKKALEYIAKNPDCCKGSYSKRLSESGAIKPFGLCDLFSLIFYNPNVGKDLINHLKPYSNHTFNVYEYYWDNREERIIALQSAIADLEASKTWWDKLLDIFNHIF